MGMRRRWSILKVWAPDDVELVWQLDCEAEDAQRALVAYRYLWPNDKVTYRIVAY